MQQYLDNSSDTLKAVFDEALKRERGGKFDNPRLILKAMTRVDEEGATYAEILRSVQQEAAAYPTGNLTTYLKELQTAKRKDILRLDLASGKYFFADPLYYAYARCHFVPPKESTVLRIRLMGEDFKMEAIQAGFRKAIQASYLRLPHHGEHPPTEE